MRLSWSPDGHYLVSAHAMNNSGPTAQIIEREGWKTNMDFVGHRKAVTVVVSARDFGSSGSGHCPCVAYHIKYQNLIPVRCCGSCLWSQQSEAETH